MAQSATEHCQNVLAAIIPNRRDLLDQALLHLTIEHFTNTELRNMYIMLERYANVTSSIITRHALGDILRGQGADSGKVLMYEELYDLLAEKEVNEGDFIWSLQQVRELAAERSTGEALAQAMEILQRGAKGPKGKDLHGHIDARHHVLEAFAEIDRALAMQDAPEGNIREETDKMLADYAARKKARLEGTRQGVLFGIPELDIKVGGLQRGELDLTVGFTSSGKTSLCVQLAWHAAVMQGLNVVFCTTETLRPQVGRKLVSRHSKLDIFGLPEGLNTRDLKDALLPEDVEDKYQEVLHDFKTNPNYGKINVMQLPIRATIGSVESRLYRIGRSMQVDLLIVDYLQQFRSERRRDSDREEQGQVVRDAKQLAYAYDDGRGVPIVSPWQVNRTSRDKAMQAGYYTMSSLSETHEASASADVLISLLEPADNESRYAELRGQILKNRDGETASSIIVDVDYFTCHFSSKSRSGSIDGLMDDDGGLFG